MEAFVGSSASIVKTIDGGDTWTILQVDSTYLDLQGIGFIDEDRGWVGPRSIPMYETTDGGLTWNQDSSLFPNINRFFRVNSELMYAAGSSIYKYDNSVVSSSAVSHPILSHAIALITRLSYNYILKV